MLCFFLSVPAWADFYHNPLLEAKDPYAVMGEAEIPAFHPPRYPVGEGTARAARLAELRKRRDAVVEACDAAWPQDPDEKGKRAPGPPEVPEENPSEKERTQWVKNAKAYLSLRDWALAFPFPEPGDDLGAERVPEARLKDLERALEILPEAVRREAGLLRTGRFLLFAENLVYLDARNISVQEFPNFKDWRDKIPEVLDRIRKILRKGGEAGAEATVRTWSQQILVGEIMAKGMDGIRPRPEFPEEAARILEAIGPKEALPQMIEALAAGGPQVREAFLPVVRRLAKGAPRPPEKGGLKEWVAWYEKEWGSWPAGEIALPDLSPVELDPERIEAPGSVEPLPPSKGR